MLLLRIFGALLLNTLGETLVGYVLTKDLASGCASPERLVVTVWQGRLATAEALQGRFER